MRRGVVGRVGVLGIGHGAMKVPPGRAVEVTRALPASVERSLAGGTTGENVWRMQKIKNANKSHLIKPAPACQALYLFVCQAPTANTLASILPINIAMGSVPIFGRPAYQAGRPEKPRLRWKVATPAVTAPGALGTEDRPMPPAQGSSLLRASTSGRWPECLCQFACAGLRAVRRGR